MKAPGEKKMECTHCHQPVTDALWNEAQDKVYCCYGCKVVDELLDGSGNLLKSTDLDIKAFAYLEEKKILRSLLEFNEGLFSRVSIHLPAIHCSSCIYLLESLPEVEEGILEVQVHFTKKQASITFKNNLISLSKLAALLDYIGYPPDFQTKLGTGKKKKNVLLIQLGVAGFFFGNTMLLALPEYFDDSLGADAALQTFFRFLMMGFSLPVLLFSAKDYFINAFKSLRAGVLSIDLPIALGIAVLFLRSVFEVFSQQGPGYFDSLCGLVFFLLIGKWYQQKTYQNFTFDRDFRSFIPLAANLLLSNGKEKPIAVDDLQKGDVILLRKGEVLPADAILRSESALLDYSYITGESLPIEKRKDETLYAGARVEGAAIQLEISSTVDRSYLSSLWGKERDRQAQHKGSRGFTDRISQYFTPAIILIALGAAGIWSTVDTAKAITVFTAVLIVACPCALALAEPFAGGSLMRWFGVHGFFLKNVAVLNRLQEVDYLVFDKTGTLTEQHNMQVEWKGDPLSPQEKVAVASLAANSPHLLSKAIATHLQVEGAHPHLSDQFAEKIGQGVEARITGQHYKLGNATFVGLPNSKAGTRVFVQKQSRLLGYFSFHQKSRSRLTQVIRKLRTTYRLSLLSGDNESERKRFEGVFGPGADLRFNQSPRDKLQYLERLQAQGHKVLMLGDGLNDAGALKQSNVGISLCEKDVNFFPASDALLMAHSFDKLEAFIRLSKKNKHVIFKAFALSLFYNLGGLSFAVAGVLSPLICAILMPVSSISVVVYTTLANRYLVKKAFG